MLVGYVEIGRDKNLWAAFENNLFYSIGASVDCSNDLRFQRSLLERAADESPHRGAYLLDAGSNRSLPFASRPTRQGAGHEPRSSWR